MRKFQIYFVSLLVFSYCSTPEETVENETVDSTSTSSTSTSTTTTVIEEKTIVDEYGIELIEMESEMKDQFDELIAFVEKRVGIEFTEYPKYQLYTLNG